MPVNSDIYGLEEHLTNLASITEDLRQLADMISNEMMFKKPSDDDRVMNLLIGLGELQNMRFNAAWKVYEKMIKTDHEMYQAQQLEKCKAFEGVAGALTKESNA